MSPHEDSEKLEYIREAVIEIFGIHDDEIDGHPLVMKYANLQHNGSSPDPKKYLEQELPVVTLADVSRIIEEVLEVQSGRITESARFREDLEADSLDLVELILVFEEEFDIEIQDADAIKILTVGNAIEYLNQRRLEPR